MVQSAKSVAMNIDDPMAVDGWRRRNGLVSDLSRDQYCIYLTETELN